MWIGSQIGIGKLITERTDWLPVSGRCKQFGLGELDYITDPFGLFVLLAWLREWLVVKPAVSVLSQVVAGTGCAPLLETKPAILFFSVRESPAAFRLLCSIV